MTHNQSDSDIVERLREPVMLRYNAEQINAERKEAANEIERLRGAAQAAPARWIKISDAVDRPGRSESGQGGGDFAGSGEHMSPNETKVLGALAEAYSDYEDFCFLSFAGIAARSDIDPKLIRRTVRSLARKGLAKYGRGLWTDDGEMAGSGYACTKEGCLALSRPKQT